MFTRSQGIGGSDVAAILGVSPYKSQFDVWLEKTNSAGHVEQQDTPAMRFGRLLEPVLLSVYEEDHPGRRVVAQGGAHSDPIWHPNRICYAHVDGVVYLEAPAAGDKGGGIWEGKTARDDRDWPIVDGRRQVPIYYETQVRHYLAVTGHPWCDVTVLFRSTGDIDHIRIEADGNLDVSIIEVAEQWWRDHVETGIPPEVDGSAGAARFLTARYPAEIEERLQCDESLDQIGQRLAYVRSEIEALEAEKSLAENLIKARLGEYGSVEGDGWKATWRRSKPRQTTNWEGAAGHYMSLLARIEDWLRTGRPDEALRVLADNPVGDILPAYTRTGDGARPFVFRATGKGGN